MEELKKEAGIKLTDEEIDLVTGGEDYETDPNYSSEYVSRYCQICKMITRHKANLANQYYCTQHNPEL